MNLHDLGPAKGAKKKRKRIGRGPGSGFGKTAGRGCNGQKSRSGYSRRFGFEGGQMPLIRRVPKRGFVNIFKKEIQIVNLSSLNHYRKGSKITPERLLEDNIIKKIGDGVKILGNGDLAKSYTIIAHAFSETARKKIEEQGGTVEVIE